MATFHFELVSPDKISFSGEVDQVDVPGSEGDFGVLAGHALLIALLRPGLMTVSAGGEKTKLVVLGGFAEVGPDGLTVLADVGTSLEDFDRARVRGGAAQNEKNTRPWGPRFYFGRRVPLLGEFRKRFDHPRIGVALERHHEVGEI